MSLVNCFLSGDLTEARELIDKRIKELFEEKLELIKQVKNLTEQFGLPSDWSKRAFNNGASGGERKKGELMQSVVLAKKTKLLLLDEPDSGLEQSSRQKIVELIEDTCNSGGSVLLVTHDKELQAKYNDNKLDLSNA